MDLEEFLTELRLHGGRWKLFFSSGGMPVIRRVSSRVTKGVFDMECPVTAVCNDLMGTDYDTWTWEQAAQRLGIDHELARQIPHGAAQGLGRREARPNIALCPRREQPRARDIYQGPVRSRGCPPHARSLLEGA